MIVLTSRSNSKVGRLCPIFHGPLTLVSLCLNQFLSNYWSYSCGISSGHPYLTMIDCRGLTPHQPLLVILCRLPEKERKETGYIVGDKREGRKKEEQE